jgi:hypothetical protein
MNLGDYKLKCSQIQNEIKQLNKDIKRLGHHKKFKTIKNTSLFYFSVITFFTSLLFLDFDGKEDYEIKLREKRIKHLQDIHTTNC